MAHSSQSIVVIGGGTGSFSLLKALKNYPFELTALVNMADDGGSTGILRDELGVLPPGDIRQCLVALSEASEELRALFNFRFHGGSLQGHSFGNIFLSAVESMTTDFTDAVKIAGDVLQIKGRVLPTTLDNCQLVLRQDGQQIIGQQAVIQTHLTSRHPDLSLRPHAKLMPEARKAVAHADLIIIAPGQLYGSIAPTLLVDGMSKALQQSSATVVYVANLVNKPYQTADYAVHDYAAEIERFIGAKRLNHVIYNTDLPSTLQLKKYAAEGEFPVHIDQAALDSAHYQAIPIACLSHDRVSRDPNDTLLERSLIRHDGAAIAKLILELIQ